MHDDFGAFALPYLRAQHYFAVSKQASVGISQFPQPPGATGSRTWGHKKTADAFGGHSLHCHVPVGPFPSQGVTSQTRRRQLSRGLPGIKTRRQSTVVR